jgi:hypothetical protein
MGRQLTVLLIYAALLLMFSAALLYELATTIAAIKGGSL